MVFAQPKTVAPSQNNELQFAWHALPLQNVAPRFVAYWLDPIHNPQPRELVQPNASQSKDEESFKGMFGEDAEVGAIRAADTQKTLLVFATSSGLKRVEKWVESLDQPVRIVEIEAQIVSIAPENWSALGLKIENTGAFQTQILPTGARKKLEKLVDDGKANMVAEPYFVAANNLVSRVIVAQAAPMARIPEAQETDVSPLSIRRASVLEVTPTVNGDGTLTLLIAPSNQILLANPGNDKTDISADYRKLSASESEAATALPIALRQEKSWPTIANMRDGQTVAFSGIPAEWLASKGTDIPANIVILLTARIIPNGNE